MVRRDDPDRGWGPSDRPARAHEIPGQWPRSAAPPARPLEWAATALARDAAREAGRDAMRARVNELVARGWFLHSGQLGEFASLSAPSYRLRPWATILLIVVTFGLWIPVAAWLQGSKRRDTIMLTLGQDFRMVENYTRGW